MEEEKNTNSTNLMDFIGKISNFDYNIETNIFKKTRFRDRNVEEKFQEFYYPKNQKNRITCDFIMTITFLAAIIADIFDGFFDALIPSIICFSISTLIICSAYFVKNIEYRRYMDLLSILFFCFELLIKGIIVWDRYNEGGFGKEQTKLRYVIYQSISVNLYLVLKLEANFVFSMFYSVVNLVFMILSLYSTNNDEYFFYEGLRSILWAASFYSLRKFLDHLHRSIFSEKLRYECLYNYTFEFISGLNFNKIFMKNDQIVLIDKKIHEFLIEVNNIVVNNQKNEISERIKMMNKKEEIKILVKKEATNYSKYLNYLVLYDNNFNSNAEQEILKLNADDENFSQKLREASQKDLSLKDYLNKLNNEQKYKSSNGIILKLDSFQKLGIYKLNYEDTPIKRYFEVYFRFVSIINDDCYYDLLFYDVSEVVLSKITIYKENLIKQRFLAKIAHEFKTPINSIIGLINNMKQSLTIQFNDLDDAVSKKYENKDRETINKELNIIQNLSEYVIILVNDVIEYSKMGESLDIEPNLRQIDIEKISTFCFGILKSLINCNVLKYERIKPILNFDERLNSRKLLSDDIRIKQVLLNFISNSVKFTKIGSITLSFELDEANKSLLINVKDTGIGIKDEDKDKIFNDFIMLHDGLENNVQGSGLGLSICKSIAQKLPMKIWFESTYGQGCSFWILLPLNENDLTLIEEEENHLNSYSTPNEFYERNNDSVAIDFNKKSIQPHSKMLRDDLNNIRNINSINNDLIINENNQNINKSNNNNDIDNNNIKEDQKEKDKTPCAIRKIMNNICNNDSKKLNNNKNLNNSDNNNNLIQNYNENILPKGITNEENYPENNLINPAIKEYKFNEKPLEPSKAIEEKQLNRSVKKKILIVDDNRFINDSTNIILSRIISDNKLNFEIVQLFDGIDIIKQVIDDQRNGHLIKCIITDENMEYINGSEAVKILRDLERRSLILNVKVISLSSNNDVYTKEQMRKKGMDLTLEKPVTKMELLDSLKKINII